MNTLTGIMRSKTDKLATLRNNGMVPAVVYGAQVGNIMISVSSINFEKVFRNAGETSTIVLEIEGEKGKNQKVDVLIHEIQVDPVKGTPIHIDFLAIDMNKPIEVSVPVEFVGIAPAEKDNLGVLVKVMHEFEIEALPKDIPHSIEVSLSSLVALDDQLHVKDITLPNGVKMITDAEEVVALIAKAKEESAEDESPVDLSSIEVEKKGKKEEESEE